MLSYQNLFISLLLLFCCYATYTNLRERKIKNFCTYGLIYAGILGQIISVLSGSSGLLNSIFTIVGGFLIVLALYWFGIFAAGDAKLVWGAALLMPAGLFTETIPDNPISVKMPDGNFISENTGIDTFISDPTSHADTQTGVSPPLRPGPIDKTDCPLSEEVRRHD